MIGDNDVFISYSHADTDWLKRLQVHLKPLHRDGLISLWDDTRLRPGSQWRIEIREALDRAKIAVLLVSADFLASDFISTNELPPLLAAAEQRGTLILPLIVSPCRFEQTASLARFQAVNPPSEPLVRMRKAKREEIFVKVSRLIEHVFIRASETSGSSRSSTSTDPNVHSSGKEKPGAVLDEHARVLSRSQERLTALSTLAVAAVELFVTTSDIGAYGRPRFEFSEFCLRMGLDEESGLEVIDELEGRDLIKRRSKLGVATHTVEPTDSIFWQFDYAFHLADPETDARTVAEKLVSSSVKQIVSVNLAAELAWEPRRLNPALTFLVQNGLVNYSSSFAYPFAVYSILETPETRRYVRQ